MYQRIVLPLDGSELAELAIPHAEEMARLTGAGIHLIRVVDLISGKAYGAYIALEAIGYAEALNAEAIECGDYLGQVKDRLSAKGFRVTSEVFRGPAAHEITQGTQPGDVIIMATHGRGGVRRWLIGSVAEAVLRHASVPVLLIRADQPARVEGNTAVLAGMGNSLSR